jgi:hypothetical protein
MEFGEGLTIIILFFNYILFNFFFKEQSARYLEIEHV